MQEKLEKKVTAMTPLPNVPTIFTESEKAKKKLLSRAFRGR